MVGSIYAAAVRRAETPVLVALDRAGAALRLTAKAREDADAAFEASLTPASQALKERRIRCHEAWERARKLYAEAYAEALGALADPCKVVDDARAALMAARDETLRRGVVS